MIAFRTCGSRPRRWASFRSSSIIAKVCATVALKDAGEAVAGRSGLFRLEDTQMFRVFLILVAFLVSHVVSAASLKPQVPAAERAVYLDMQKADPATAKKYLATREYVSQCQQVVANPKLAIDAPDEPDDFDQKYITKAEVKIITDAARLGLAAYVQKKRGLSAE
jgi:hypothetical protein